MILDAISLKQTIEKTQYLTISIETNDTLNIFK